MSNSKFERCEPDDPNRCQAVGADGQCPYKSADGTTRCPRHNGPTLASERKESARLYKLAHWRQRLNELSDNPNIKTLREEVAILRMTLEAILEQCTTADHLLLYNTRIADLVVKIEKLVLSTNRLETSLGQSLDKANLIQIASRMVEIISSHVTDPDVLNAISEEIIQVISGDSDGESSS